MRSFRTLQSVGFLSTKSPASGSSRSPFCQALCKKSDVEKNGLARCKDLSEKDCRSMQYYASRRSWLGLNSTHIGSLLKRMQRVNASKQRSNFTKSLCRRALTPNASD